MATTLLGDLMSTKSPEESSGHRLCILSCILCSIIIYYNIILCILCSIIIYYNIILCCIIIHYNIILCILCSIMKMSTKSPEESSGHRLCIVLCILRSNIIYYNIILCILCSIIIYYNIISCSIIIHYNIILCILCSIPLTKEIRLKYLIP